MDTKSPRLLIIDTNALAHRAFHAFPQEWQTKRGEPTNAIYGFAAMLLQVLKTLKPDYVIAARDSKGETFRHKKFQAYKANRPKLDEMLAVQLPKITELIETLKIPVIAQVGYEADDIIGSICKSDSYKNYEKVIVTGDRDLFQVLALDTKVYMAGSSFAKSQMFDIDAATVKLGFTPDLIVDYKALRGDTSDNIPGVQGIGEVTATDLIQRFKSLEEIYQHLTELKPAVKNKLEQGKEMAYLSRELAQIHYKVPVVLDLDNSELQDLDFVELKKLFEYYEFRSLIARLPDFMRLTNQETEAKVNDTKIEFESIKIESEKQLVETLAQFTKEDELIINVDKVKEIFEIPTRIYIAKEHRVYQIGAAILNPKTIKILDDLFKVSNISVFDAKPILHALLSVGISDLNFKNDLSIIDYLLRGGVGKFGLEASLERVLGIKVEQQQQATLFAEADLCTQTYQILLLSKKLVKEFETATNTSKWDLKRLYQGIELPLVKVLVDVERNGIKLDAAELKKFALELTDLLATLEKEIYEEAGETFNISSPKQLGHILYEKMQIPVGKKTKGGAFSTNEKALLNNVLGYPIISKILSYREFFKLKSTYTNTLIEQINPKTGRVHTTYNQAVVATGRLSSTNPNLQNIPTSTEMGTRIREAFIAERSKKLISFDYSQQELRLLAHLSHEEKLVKAFVDGIDIHSATAAQIYHIDVSTVSKEQRRVGKTVNFGVVYGISSYGLAEQLKISNKDAQSLIDAFYISYPKAMSYFNQLKADARNNGYVETLYGRRRDASGLNNPNFQLRSAVEREIINFPLQGSAADIMKLAMVNADKVIKEKYASFAKMVLQVHDELIFEIDADNEKVKLEFINSMIDVMGDIIKLDVPMNVSYQDGENWGKLK